MQRIRHAMTVDVEDYFQVSAFENIIPREKWCTHPFRVQANTEIILKLFEENQVKATFFILGWVAERCPQLIRQIEKLGHEVACHSYYHQRVDTLNPEAFRKDTLRAKQLLEDIAGTKVIGYRAPTYSINPKTPWAHQVLEELGFVYSSSVYPIHHDIYGWPKAPRFPFMATPGGLIEIPITTYHATINWPCGGGGYFRLFPYALSRYMLRKIERQEKKSCMFYFHPWEIDVAQPRLNTLPFKTRFRHYLNLKRMQPRIEQLLKDFHWDTIHDVFIKGLNIKRSGETTVSGSHKAA